LPDAILRVLDAPKQLRVTGSEGLELKLDDGKQFRFPSLDRLQTRHNPGAHEESDEEQPDDDKDPTPPASAPTGWLSLFGRARLWGRFSNIPVKGYGHTLP
jgi:hypothetical protein